MKTKVTEEVSDFIFKNYLAMSRGSIAKHFGFSIEVCHGFYKRNNLNVSKELIKKWQVENRYRPYTEVDNQYIIANIETKSIKQIATELVRSSCTLQKQVHFLGLTHIIERKKKCSYFTKGHVPKNKGLKQVEYMSLESIEKTKATRFKKGFVPLNTLVDGTETSRTDRRSGKVYTLLKVPGVQKLKYKQIQIWETFHETKLQKGFNIIFKDANTQNFNIENLESISDSELMSRNTIQRYPIELKQEIFKLGKLKRTIKKIEK
jgi:HNH endonuclease